MKTCVRCQTIHSDTESVCVNCGAYLGCLFTSAELVDLRALLSVAIWIRSEQLAHPDAILHVQEQLGTNLKVAVELDTHGQSIALCRAQMNRAQQFWKKLTDILGVDISKASWE